jgi:MFS family permease
LAMRQAGSRFSVPTTNRLSSLRASVFQLHGTIKGHNRNVHVLVLCRSITALGFSVVFPFLGLYLHNEMGVSMTGIGSIFLGASLAGAVAALVGGELSDRFGRKRVMIAALSMRTLIFFLMSLAVWSKGGFAVIAGLVILSTFTGRLFEPPAGALISDVTTPSRRQEAYALLRIGINLGWAIGPAVGGFLASSSYASLFLASGLVTLVGLLLLSLWLKDSRQRTQTEKLGLRDLTTLAEDRRFLSYNLISMLLFLVAAQLIMAFSVYSVEWVGITKMQLGYIYALNGFMVVVLQFPCVRLLQRFRMSRIMALGSLLYAAGYFSMTFAGYFHTAYNAGFAALFVSIIVVTFGEIFTSPPSLALVANMAPPGRYGRYMGVYELFSSVGHFLGPFLGGLIMDAGRGNALLVWGPVGALGVSASIGFVILGSRLSPAVDHPVPGEIPVPVKHWSAEIPEKD